MDKDKCMSLSLVSSHAKHYAVALAQGNADATSRSSRCICDRPREHSSRWRPYLKGDREGEVRG